MKQNPFSHENSLNLTNYSFLDHGFEKNNVISHYNMDETDISILNAMNSKKNAKNTDISSTLKEIDDLLLRLRPGNANFLEKKPEIATFPRNYAENPNKFENLPRNPYKFESFAKTPAETRQTFENFPKKDAFLQKPVETPAIREKTQGKLAIFPQKRVNAWEIPLNLNANDISSAERKTSDKEQEFDVFLMEKNLKLRQISKSFSQYLSVFDANAGKLSLKSRVFSPIAKYYASVIANDGNSVGLFCDVKQIEKFLGDFLEILPQTGGFLEISAVKAWILAIRGLFLAKEKFLRVKVALKLSGNENNNMSLTSNSVTLGNEPEILENIESDEEFEE